MGKSGTPAFCPKKAILSQEVQRFHVSHFTPQKIQDFPLSPVLRYKDTEIEKYLSTELIKNMKLELFCDERYLQNKYFLNVLKYFNKIEFQGWTVVVWPVGIMYSLVYGIINSGWPRSPTSTTLVKNICGNRGFPLWKIFYINLEYKNYIIF